MPPSGQPTTEVSHKVAVLRGLLQQESNRPKVAPLVACLVARNVETHERMFTDLGNKLQKVQNGLSSESEHAIRISERLHNIEEDVKSLRQLIQRDEKDIVAGADLDQLETKLADAVKQMSTQTANVKKRFQTIEGMIQEQQQTTAMMKETTAQRIASVQRDINEFKHYLEKLLSTPPVLESIEKLEEKTANRFDQDPKGYIKRCLETIATKVDLNEHPSCVRPVSGAMDQSIDDKTHTSSLDYSMTSCEESSTQPDLKLWPAIAEFVTIYEHFRGKYKSEEIANEQQFIETFLSEMNVHVSCALQRHLLDIYPKKVALIPLEVGQQSPSIFIGLSHMKWSMIRRAVPKISNLKSLQFAVNEGISGPTQTQISRQINRIQTDLESLHSTELQGESQTCGISTPNV
ncbi:hypothetical protein O1611_g3658 [Lasiodiplodia mahajangana]|uniref:Uncharacterized protein n=1 Tax=Lasiodiplodia mahajangana TaxID=1108764 RepID=A0ACC2JR61_9PEZI|nr:hypothetical protein O1611_g3658 [Lasiodiplodia mahajangana]